jgi:MOSC domain-containing protein YiiM
MARLLSVNVGLPRDIEWKGRIVRTGIWKIPVHGRCRVGRLNLNGDGQGDLGGHGGEQRAAFVYQIESYRYWQEQLKRTDFVHGQFGEENFTVEGLPDDAVCIGDRYQIGGALFEVTQPRVTCYRVGIRTDEPRMPALLTSSGLPGFYFRVLREGVVGAGDEIVKVGEANERMTVAEINALLYSPDHARDRLERALRIEALRPDGAHRSRHCCGARRLAREVATPGSRRQLRRIPQRRDFSGSRWWRSMRSPRTSSPCRWSIQTASDCHRLCQVSTSSCVFGEPPPGHHCFAAIRSRVGSRPSAIGSA